MKNNLVYLYNDNIKSKTKNKQERLSMTQNLFFGRNDKMMKTEKFYGSEFSQDVRLHTFNLPAIDSCPGAGICKNFCYATQGRYIFKTVAAPREHNFNTIKGLLKSAQTDDEAILNISNLLQENIISTFGKRINKFTNNKGQKVRNIIRIHDSGDFFHRLYFLAWCDALEKLNKTSNIQAYAYTKSVRIIQPLMDRKPLNLHIIQSVGGLWDNEINKDLPHSKVFSNESDMLQAGYIDGSLTDIPAIEGAVKIGLIYHGTKSVSKVKKFLV